MKELSKKEKQQVGVPAFVREFDHSVELARMHNQDHRVMGIYFLGEDFCHDNAPYTYSRAAAFGDEDALRNAIIDCFVQSPGSFRLISDAWYNHFINSVPADTRDDKLRNLRSAIIRYVGTENGKERTALDEMNDYFEQLSREHPLLNEQISILRSKAKTYRRQNMYDLQLIVEQHIYELTERHQHQQDEADRMALDHDRRISVAAEARRVRQQHQQEQLEQQRLEHDYDHLTRRIRAYRTMIERLQAEMDAIAEEQRQMQLQHPQFDPHSAAKRKRQQLAERKRERARSKKKGKEGVIDNVGSCSQILRKVV